MCKISRTIDHTNNPVDQESALKAFFLEHGWSYCKPDLSITTEKLGPSLVPLSNAANLAESLDKVKKVTESYQIVPVCDKTGGKRKTEALSQNNPAAKQLKPDCPAKSAETESNYVGHSCALTESCDENLTFPVAMRCENEGQVVVKSERAGDKELKQIESAASDATDIVTYQLDKGQSCDGNNSQDEEIENNSGHAIAPLNDQMEGTSEDHLDELDNKDVKNSGIEVEDSGVCFDDESVSLREQSYANDSMEKVINIMESLLGHDLKQSAEEQVEGLFAICKRSSNDYVCCVCAKNIKMKYNMKRHLRIHLPNKTNCVICNKFFNNEEQKDKHIREKHASRHICEVCGVTFKRKSDMNRHMLRHEKLDGTAPVPNFFKCEFKDCGKIFFRETNFQFHLNMHNDEKPFACSRCSKYFHSEYSKNAHEKACLNNTKFTCDKCGKEFKQPSGLYNHVQAEHVRKEEGFSCELCSQKFKYLTGLIKHKKEKHQSIDATQQTDMTVNDRLSEDVIIENKMSLKPQMIEESNNGRSEGGAITNNMEQIGEFNNDKEPQENLIASKLEVEQTLTGQVVTTGADIACVDHVIVLRQVPTSSFIDHFNQSQE